MFREDERRLNAGLRVGSAGKWQSAFNIRRDNAMNTIRRHRQSIRIATRAAMLAVFMIGPLAGFAAAQDDSARKLTGAGFVLYVSLMRNA